MVMVFHPVYIVTYFKEMAHAASFGLISLPELGPYTQWGWVGVQIFFVISGYVIALTAEHATPRSFIVSRITRLAPAVWICAPLTFFALTAGLSMPPKTELLHSMLFIPWRPWVDGAYWTLGIEIIFYSLVLVLVTLKRFSLVRQLAILIGFSSTIFWGWFQFHLLNGHFNHAQLDAVISDRFLDLLLIHHGCLFAVGVLIWLSINKGQKNLPYLFLFSSGSVLQILAEAAKYNSSGSPVYAPWIPVVVWLMSIAFLVWSIHQAALFQKFPRWFSRHVEISG